MQRRAGGEVQEGKDEGDEGDEGWRPRPRRGRRLGPTSCGWLPSLRPAALLRRRHAHTKIDHALLDRRLPDQGLEHRQAEAAGRQGGRRGRQYVVTGTFAINSIGGFAASDGLIIHKKFEDCHGQGDRRGQRRAAARRAGHQARGQGRREGRRRPHRRQDPGVRRRPARRKRATSCSRRRLARRRLHPPVTLAPVRRGEGRGEGSAVEKRRSTLSGDPLTLTLSPEDGGEGTRRRGRGGRTIQGPWVSRAIGARSAFAGFGLQQEDRGAGEAWTRH